MTTNREPFVTDEQIDAYCHQRVPTPKGLDPLDEHDNDVIEGHKADRYWIAYGMKEARTLYEAELSRKDAEIEALRDAERSKPVAREVVSSAMLIEEGRQQLVRLVEDMLAFMEQPDYVHSLYREDGSVRATKYDVMMGAKIAIAPNDSAKPQQPQPKCLTVDVAMEEFRRWAIINHPSMSKSMLRTLRDRLTKLINDDQSRH
jgi:hypothetical protein